MHYKLYTLVDITQTKQYQNDPARKQARSQQQNFDTLLQTIGIRANIEYDKSPLVLVDIPAKFGLEGTVLSNIWVWEWRTEREHLFELNGDDVGHLKDLFKLVPYISNLTETTPKEPAVFLPGKNIVFEMLV